MHVYKCEIGSYIRDTNALIVAKFYSLVSTNCLIKIKEIPKMCTFYCHLFFSAKWHFDSSGSSWIFFVKYVTECFYHTSKKLNFLKTDTYGIYYVTERFDKIAH